MTSDILKQLQELQYESKQEKGKVLVKITNPKTPFNVTEKELEEVQQEIKSELENLWEKYADEHEPLGIVENEQRLWKAYHHDHLYKQLSKVKTILHSLVSLVSSLDELFRWAYFNYISRQEIESIFFLLKNEQMGRNEFVNKLQRQRIMSGKRPIRLKKVKRLENKGFIIQEDKKLTKDGKYSKGRPNSFVSVSESKFEEMARTPISWCSVAYNILANKDDYKPDEGFILRITGEIIVEYDDKEEYQDSEWI